MIGKTLVTKMFLIGVVLAALLSAVIISGCMGDTGLGDDREGADSGGEHSGRREESGGSGEHGSGGDESTTSSDGGGEINEAAMSSPITSLGQSWNGDLGGLAVSMQYDAATQAVHGTVRNTLSQKLCYVQAEPHLKSGTKTVGELGPEKLGHLNPGQEATTSLTVASEPDTCRRFLRWICHSHGSIRLQRSWPCSSHGRRRYRRQR